MQSPQLLVRDILAGKAGSVNELMRQFGREVSDLALAVTTQPGPAFEVVVTEIFADVLRQCRAADLHTPEAFRLWVLQSAAHTLSARFGPLLQSVADPYAPGRFMDSRQVMQALGIDELALSMLVSEGKLRAFRANDGTAFVRDDLQALGVSTFSPAESLRAVSGLDRALLSLYFRLGVEPETLARWFMMSPDDVEMRLEAACEILVRLGVVSESFN